MSAHELGDHLAVVFWLALAFALGWGVGHTSGTREGYDQAHADGLDARLEHPAGTAGELRHLRVVEPPAAAELFDIEDDRAGGGGCVGT